MTVVPSLSTSTRSSLSLYWRDDSIHRMNLQFNYISSILERYTIISLKDCTAHSASNCVPVATRHNINEWQTVWLPQFDCLNILIHQCESIGSKLQTVSTWLAGQWTGPFPPSNKSLFDFEWHFWRSRDTLQIWTDPFKNTRLYCRTSWAAAGERGEAPLWMALKPLT